MNDQDLTRYHLRAETRAWHVTGILLDPTVPVARSAFPPQRIPKFEEIFQVPPYQSVAGDLVLEAFRAARRVYQARKPRYKELMAKDLGMGFDSLAALIMRDIELRLLDMVPERWLIVLSRNAFIYFDRRRFRASRPADYELALAAADRLKKYRLHRG